MIAEYSDTYTIVFIYDAAGSPIGMRYRSASFASEVWETYWYEKNLQGDIIAIYSNDGIKLISYIYDAWGNFEMEYEDAAFDYNAERNPLTYRGYYYDSDLGLYYLRSRYYDPNTGRFISPDNIDVIGATPMDLTDKNLFAYCDNNPVMRVDEDGEFWIPALIGAVINVTTTFIAAVVTGQDYTLVDVAVNAVAGAANAIPGVGPLISGAIVGGHYGVASFNDGATLEEAILVGVVTGVATTVTISNIANWGKGALRSLSVSVAAISDFVFGVGANSLAAAVYRVVDDKSNTPSRFARARQTRGLE